MSIVCINSEVFVLKPLAFQPIQVVFLSCKLLQLVIVYFSLSAYAVPKTIGLFLISHHHNYKSVDNLLSFALWRDDL